MRFLNATPWIAVIDIIDTAQNVVRAELGMIGAGKEVEIPIETYRAEEPETRAPHDGTICLVEERGAQTQHETFFVSPTRTALRPLQGATPLAIRLSCMEKPSAGMSFAIEIARVELIEQKRREAEELFGRRIHIRHLVGPIRIEDDTLTCPIEAVDDRTLGRIDRFPKRPDHILLTGYFK